MWQIHPSRGSWRLTAKICQTESWRLSKAEWLYLGDEKVSLTYTMQLPHYLFTCLFWRSGNQLRRDHRPKYYQIARFPWWGWLRSYSHELMVAALVSYLLVIGRRKVVGEKDKFYKKQSLSYLTGYMHVLKWQRDRWRSWRWKVSVHRRGPITSWITGT